LWKVAAVRHYSGTFLSCFQFKKFEPLVTDWKQLAKFCMFGQEQRSFVNYLNLPCLMEFRESTVLHSQPTQSVAESLEAG
jgi:hypothetical protein